MENNDYTLLYTEEDITILKTAEDSLNPKLDRVEELIEYCREANINKIGIANCISFNKETEYLETVLNEKGFEVEKVHCKLGKVPFNNLIEGYKGVSCNPAGQAKYLENKNTELNIIIGLCVGHDMIFNAKSKAPSTTLVVKDRKLKHHTVKILRTSIVSPEVN